MAKLYCDEYNDNGKIHYNLHQGGEYDSNPPAHPVCSGLMYPSKCHLTEGRLDEVTCQNCRRTVVFKEALIEEGNKDRVLFERDLEETTATYDAPLLSIPIGSVRDGNTCCCTDKEFQTRMGWICPSCSKNISPDVKECKCDAS
jgi:hypothetical protein